MLADPRQQDHRLTEDELVTYRHSVVLVKVQSGISLQVKPNIFTNFCNDRINWVFPKEILINKNAHAGIFYVNFRLEMNIFNPFIIKYVKFWLILASRFW